MDACNDFSSLLNWLNGKSSFHMELGLERIQGMLRSLHLHEPDFKIIQVIGTNGKGSTSSFLASLARVSGLKTGLYTSPHMLSPRERILINGKQLSEPLWLECSKIILQAGGDRLTYFEFITVLAALAFQRSGVQLAIFEAGLGGKNDATSALPAQLTVFTPISLDHQQIIGPSLRDIAFDKVAAIRSGQKSVVSAAQTPEAFAILQEVSAKKGAHLELASTSILPSVILSKEKPLRLWGQHQFDNAALALTAWRVFCEQNSLPIDQEAELRGLCEAWIPGRLQWVFPAVEKNLPLLLLDGGHNPHGLASVGKSLALAGVRPAACIFSCVADKDVENMLAHLRVLCPAPIFVSPLPDNPRAIPPEKLARRIGLSAVSCASFAEALEKARTQQQQILNELPAGHSAPLPILVCGSLYLLAEFFKLYPESMLSS